MTTRVVISVPTNNHLAAKYTFEQWRNDNRTWEDVGGGIIRQGSCVEKNIWNGSRIVVEEIEIPVEESTNV